MRAVLIGCASGPVKKPAAKLGPSLFLWTRCCGRPQSLCCEIVLLRYLGNCGDTRMSWTDDRIDQLKSLWTEGLSASHIAKVMGGISRNAVIGKVHRLGLAGRAGAPRGERIRLPSAPRAAMRTHVP